MAFVSDKALILSIVKITATIIQLWLGKGAFVAMALVYSKQATDVTK